MSAESVLAYDLFRAVVLLVALAMLGGRLRGRRWPSALAIVGIGLGLAWAWGSYQIPYDFKRFWRVGRDLAAGMDYYRLDPHGDRQLILNPPTILPLFRLWAMMPLPTASRNWTILNVLGVLGLVPLAQSALRSQSGADAPRLPGRLLLVLSAALALSCGQGMGLALGQISLLAVAAIFAALRAQGAGRSWWAGFWLGIATIKVNTMLPFLLLFLRWRDVPTWVALGLTTAGLCLMTGGPVELPTRITTTLRTIRATFEPGRVNDYAEAGPSHASLVGIDQALHRLGLRDRGWIAALQGGILIGIGLGLGWGIRSDRWPREVACGLVALYAGIFFYHRLYDMLLLALPIVGMALTAQREPSRRLRAAGILVLLVLFVNPEGLLAVERITSGLGFWGQVGRAGMMPLAIWLIVAALALGWRSGVESECFQGTRIRSRIRPRMASAESPSASAS